MSTLTARQERLLTRLGWTQRGSTVLGLVLTVLGTVYASWAVLRFDPRADPRDDPGFDRPIAGLAFLYDRFETQLDSIETETPRERLLVSDLRRSMHFSAGILALVVRVALGTLMVVAGLVVLTVVVERRRLLQIIARLRAAREGWPPP